MSLKPETGTIRTDSRRYGMAIGSEINTWGQHLNNDLADIASRIDKLENAPPPAEPHTTAGLVAGVATAAAIGLNVTKPVSRRSLFDAFRKSK